MHDDLGFHVALHEPARRVVSLVPSLTEAIAATRPDALVGATQWCTHPADLAVPRVRGTKNPDLAAIRALSPDVVIANKEENRELDVRRLREAGVPVWVTDIETLDEAFASMRRLFDEALGWGVPAWLVEAERRWAEPAEASGRRVAVAIWRDPWMVVGRDTFTGDLLRRLGLANAFAEAPERYPHVDVAALDAGDLDLVLLPDEPYVFTADDGPEAFTTVPTALCSGRALTWYGPSLLTARQDLAAALA
ncbi:cobalamin-binding protein [Aeromicrobium sp. 636]|uniref:Cobalamin-binding protein n=1 Tax=Aeromicrobium senzhongii TaxID=2663859 RepID=A0A8I0ETX1_9ACTN|nr:MULTISPECIES: helical backbone metal receptor [Aeromicrobium]MBC9226034.1 cobalamin-binding protein [Aeromicrobium senzhongii]MCQ3998141.1 cobalamin-binding protein [Aeromicrobium sp. 636]